MSSDRPLVDYEIKQGEIYLGQHFPSRIEMRMFQNYVCDDCDSKLRQAIELAVYENPKMRNLLGA